MWLYILVCQWLATGWWFSPCTPLIKLKYCWKHHKTNQLNQPIYQSRGLIWLWVHLHIMPLATVFQIYCIGVGDFGSWIIKKILGIAPLMWHQGSHYFQIRESSQRKGKDNREKWGDFWDKLMVIITNWNIVLQLLLCYPAKIQWIVLKLTDLICLCFLIHNCLKDIFPMSNIYFCLHWLLESWKPVIFYMYHLQIDWS